MLLRLLLSRPRLFLCILAGLAVTLLIPESLAQQSVTRSIIGWNVGACLYLALAARIFYAALFRPSHTRSTLS